MKTSRRLLWLSVILCSVFLQARAQEEEGAQPRTPPKHRIELVYIFEAGSTEFIFVIGNVGFKSVTALKGFVGNLPPGSTLEWAPGCKSFGGEPLLSSAQELEEFKAFCAERGINFILVPSG